VTRVLVDTSALLAFLDGDDPRHEAVVSAFASSAEDELVTHGYVVAETLAVARRRLGLEATVALLDDVLPALDTLPVDGQLHAIALRRYRAAIPTETSFVDHVTLALMEQESITTVFALDADLAGPGVRLVPPLG
jgi:predicted nucleic acid-binding protein